MLCLNIQMFASLITIGQLASFTVKRNADLKDIDIEDVLGQTIVESGDSETEHSQLSEDHMHILADNEFKVLLTASEEYDDNNVSIYESIRDENQDILTKIEKLYSAFKSHEHHHGHQPDLPLVSMVEQEPHSMTIRLKPKEIMPDTMVRLSYERVPSHRKPCMAHLDDPVLEYIPLIRTSQTYEIRDLPKGKYIVCGEAMDQGGEVYQESCFETRIRRQEVVGLQSGVQVLIVISLVIVLCVIVYAILFQICKRTCRAGPANE